VNYNHHTKAGNNGDVVKHVALLAVLDSLLAAHAESDDFFYADTFAGYAYSPLIKGNEWTSGIGSLADKGETLSQNRHTGLWHSWYLRGRPQLLGGVYPGSSLIATDVCRYHKKNPRLSLWEISLPVIGNLMETYWKQGHRIRRTPANPKSKAIQTADLVFIDPPGLKSLSESSYPPWRSLRRFLDQQQERQSVLVWLPVRAVKSKKARDMKSTSTVSEEDEASIQARDDAMRLGLQTIRVRWSADDRTFGCLLICRVPSAAWKAMDAAVRHVVRVAQWQEHLRQYELAAII
jgi:23S rRNA A2030 N6-methylase RlmJ